MVLGGNFGGPSRLPADAEPQCSNPTCGRPSGQPPGLDSDSGCRSFGKAQAGLDVRRATSRIAVQYARITPVVALKKRRVFSREDAGRLLQRTGGDSRPTTPSARIPPVVVYDTDTCLLREAASGVVVAGGNSSAAIQEGVTPVVAPGCVPWPLRGRRGESGALELAPELPRARIRDLRLSWLGCDQRLPREPADSSRRLESFSSAATPRATIRRSQRQRATSPFGRPGVLTSSSGDAIQALVGRSVRLPSGGAM